MKTVKIGTRASQLALWQAHHIQSVMTAAHAGYAFELEKIKTQGDKILDVALAKVGGKGLFVKELEDALLDRRVDFCVHSMKDVPVDLPEGLHIVAITEREDPRDAFLSVDHESLEKLPEGAKVGTSSLRRQCQLLSLRPDLKIEMLRGNVETRIRKMTEGIYDAIILAHAGVKRLGLTEHVREVISDDVMIPAIGQGALGIECREGDEAVGKLLAILDHADTSCCVRAERSYLRVLQGGCQVPIGAYATVKGSELSLTGLVGALNGESMIRMTITGDRNDAERLGIELAKEVLSSGAKAILEEVYGRAL